MSKMMWPQPHDWSPKTQPPIHNSSVNNQRYQNANQGSSNIVPYAIVIGAALLVCLLIPLCVWLDSCRTNHNAEMEQASGDLEQGKVTRQVSLDRVKLVRILLQQTSRKRPNHEWVFSNRFLHISCQVLKEEHFAKDLQSQSKSVVNDTLHGGGVMVLPGGRHSVSNLCAICISQFQVGETLVWSSNPSCEHVFHATCMHLWCQKHSLCPCCRQEFLIAVSEGSDTDDDKVSATSV